MRQSLILLTLISTMGILAACSQSPNTNSNKNEATHSFSFKNHSKMSSDISSTDDFVVTPLKGRDATAVHITLINKSKRMDDLIAATSPVAAKVQLHRFNSSKEMVQVLNGIELPAHSKEMLDARDSLSSGGYHVMLINLKHQLKVGEIIPVTLIFKDGSYETIKAAVKQRTQVEMPK